MASEVLSIEAGDGVIRVCSISPGKGKTGSLNKAFMFRTPQGTVSDGVITDPEVLAQKLSEKLAANKMAGIKNVVFTLASGKVATREATLPPVSEKKIKAVLDANMTEYFPMDISKYQIDYGMVRQTSEGGTKGLSLTLMAAPLSIVDSYVRFAKEAGLIIDAIDYAGNSQYQFIKSLNVKKASMFINVDCQYSYVTIVQGGDLVFQRMLPYGGNEYIEAYRSAAEDNIDFVDALNASCVTMEEMSQKGVMTDEMIEDALSRVVSGIARSMDFFNTLRANVPLEEVVLVGACAHLAGLREMVAETTNHEYVYYLEECSVASSLGQKVAIISSFVSAFGATIKPVQLLPTQYLAAKGKKKGAEEGEEKQTSILIPIVIGVVIAIAGGVLAFIAWDENQNLTRERDRIVSDIEATRYIEQVEETYLKYREDARGFRALDITLTYDMKNEGLVRFFEELERKMPADLKMLSAVCTNENVVMNIRVGSLEAAAKVLVEFRSFESLTDVKTAGLVLEYDEGGFKYYGFTVNCMYYGSTNVDDIVDEVIEAYYADDEAAAEEVTQ